MTLYKEFLFLLTSRDAIPSHTAGQIMLYKAANIWQILRVGNYKNLVNINVEMSDLSDEVGQVCASVSLIWMPFIALQMKSSRAREIFFTFLSRASYSRTFKYNSRKRSLFLTNIILPLLWGAKPQRRKKCYTRSVDCKDYLAV